MTADGNSRAACQDFIIYEAGLLDARRFRDWMGLFAEDGTYWVPAVPQHLRRVDLEARRVVVDWDTAAD